MGGKLHLRLNIGERPIANKYREGKMKRSLKRELKVLEIAKREANKPNHLFSVTPLSVLLAAFRVFCSVCIHCRRSSSCYCLQCHNQFGLRENLYLLLDWGFILPCLMFSLPWPIDLSAQRCFLWFLGTGLLESAESWLWRNGFIWPVLKHGPRSLTYMRVFGCWNPNAQWKWRRLALR